jgi:hypothetical protein
MSIKVIAAVQIALPATADFSVPVITDLEKFSVKGDRKTVLYTLLMAKI